MKNTQLQTLVVSLKKLGIEQGCKLWKRVASDLEGPSRRRRSVNLYKIDQFARDGEVVIVPGKVLGDGVLSKKVTIAAYSFSEQAREKINESGKALSIAELMKQNPKGQKVRIMG